MHHLEIDWREMAQRVAVWRQLDQATRSYLLAHSFNDSLDAQILGEDFDGLAECRFIAKVGTGRITFHPSYRPFARALRAMHRHRILTNPSPQVFTEYLRDNYTVEERRLLVMPSGRAVSGDGLNRRAGSATWLEPALDAAHDRSDARHKAGLIVRAVLDRGGVLPVEDIAGALDDVVHPAALSSALNIALGNVWLLATMADGNALPVLAIWPPIVKRLSRTAAPAPRPRESVVESGGAFLLDDAAAVLIAASTEPLRLRGTDFTLFAKAAQRIEAALVPISAPLNQVTDWSAEIRVSAAVSYMRSLGFVQSRGRPGRDLRLEVTKAGREWLALPAVERIRPLLDFVRIGRETRQSSDGARGRLRIVDSDIDDDFDDVEFGDDDDVYPTPAGRPTRLALFADNVYPDRLRTAMESAAAAAYRDCDTGTVSINEFARYHAEQKNPLIPQPEGYGHVRGMHLSRIFEAEAEVLWTDLLIGVLLNRLIPFGGAIAARIPGVGIGFRLTGAGRYILGIDDQLDVADVPGIGVDAGAPAQIVVQPNFEIVFLAPAPAAEAELGRFAERAGTGVGTLFRVTRNSVFTAAAAGLAADDALDTLRRLSSQPIPQNVAREIAGWFGACRRGTIGSAFLLRFPDADTATRALAATGRDAVRLAPTVLELVGAGAKAAIVKKLRKEGIFVDEKDGVESRGRRGRRG